MLCIVIKDPQQIPSAIASGADLLELRVDCFAKWDLHGLKVLLSECSLPMIFTLRGGSYEDIARIASLKPAYLDLESDASASFIQQISAKYPEVKIILSYHNFSNTPEDLEDLYRQMEQIPAHFYKIATMAGSCHDAMRMLLLAKKFAPKLIGIAMGEQGEISRILAPIVGCPITFASLEEPLAPGQLPAKTLLEKYRYRSLHPPTAIYGLIGDPVSQSMSDTTHNRLMGELGFDAVYIKVQVTASQLPSFLHYARQLPFSGLSVTMPLKEHILARVDEIDPEAREIGAVNTLVFREGKILGFNTDGKGALDAIEKSFPVKGKKMVIIGAGGAAKAIAYEAKRRGAELTILNRDKKKALALAERLHCKGGGLDCREAYDILLNCTPSPMPIAPQAIIPGTVAMDIKSREGEFTKAALEKGCEVIYGREMFMHQALGQFSLWFTPGKRFH